MDESQGDQTSPVEPGRTISPRTIGPRGYRRVVAWAGASLALIVMTGAAVRLTEAGLGCEDWPACSDESFVPAWELHPWIEFGNRLISGVVAIAVIAAVLTAYRRRPRRRDLIGLAWGLVIGVAAQVILGGITVRVDLHPAIVGLHFLLSMVLLANAVVLWVRAGADGARDDDRRHDGPAPATDRFRPSIPSHGWLLVALAAVVLVTGTLVTGTGPNSGDSRAERLSFELVAIARVHSVAVWCYLTVLVALVLRLSAIGSRRAVGLARVLVVATLAQGAVGYVQFATGVPPELVALHIAGSMVVWCTSILVALELGSDRPGAEAEATEPRVTPSRVLDRMGA